MHACSPLAAGALLLVTLASTDPARANLEDELTGVRSTAMGGAHRAVGTGNDAIYLNAAGMAIVQRYSIEAHYGYLAQGDVTQLNISAVDSKTSPLAAGLGYTRDHGEYGELDAALNRFYLAFAYPLAEGVAVGVTGRHVVGEYKDAAGAKEKVKATSGDAALLVRLGSLVTLGATYNNFVESEDQFVVPRGYGLGAALNLDMLVLTGDFQVTRPGRDNEARRYSGGAEYFVGGVYPIRLGVQNRPFLRAATGKMDRENVLTGGVGWVNPGGAIDVAATQSLERERVRTFLAAVRFFL